MEYETLRKYISHPSLVIYSFATLPIKLKLGQEMGGGSTNSKAPGPIITMSQSDTLTEQQLDHIYYTATWAIMRGQNHFAEPNRHTLDFLHPILV